MGFFRGTRRFLNSLDCRSSNDLQDAVVVDATLPNGKTKWPTTTTTDPQYHGFMLWTRSGLRKISDDIKSKSTSTVEVSHNSSFGSDMDHHNNVMSDDAASEGDHSFHDASKSPLPSPSKPLKSILASSMNHLSIDLNDLDTIYSDNAVVALLPPSSVSMEDCSHTLYSLDTSKLPMSPSRRSIFSAESSIMDMSTVMDRVVEGNDAYDGQESVEFLSPTNRNASANQILQALMAIDAPKIVAANDEIQQQEIEDFRLADMNDTAPEPPRKTPSIISEESRATDFSYTDIADRVDPEHDFASITEPNSPSGHSRNYLSNFLMHNTPVSPPKRRASIADDESDVSSVTYMSPAMLERSLEEEIPERIKLSTISNVAKATKIASKIRKLRHKFSKQYAVFEEDGNSSIDMLTIASEDGTIASKCLVLLLDPKRRTFDFIHVEHCASVCTAQDLLDQIPLTNSTDFGLRFQKYAGLVHGSIHGKEALTIMQPHQHVPERFSVLFDEQESPLVAIPEGFSPAQAHALARILFGGKRSPARRAFDEMQEFLLSGLDF